ncbi:hypothetical protein DTO212C5_1518 [Paecilomyces variotii]|nr:hypothetical protein DTO212C5_1518 [Paecilomyces variotii]
MIEPGPVAAGQLMVEQVDRYHDAFSFLVWLDLSSIRSNQSPPAGRQKAPPGLLDWWTQGNRLSSCTDPGGLWALPRSPV